MKKGFINWSGGKDALMAFHLVNNQENIKVDLFLSIINKSSQKNALHEIPLHLLQKQAEALHCDFEFIELPDQVDNKTYQNLMHEKWESLKNKGYSHSVFGDIFLEDIKSFRENQLQSIGLEGVFPLWKKPTDQLADFFIKQNFQAIVVSCENQSLNETFCGRKYDHQFIKDLPPNVDPCGENGEFHTFCYNGPLFNQPISFKKSAKKLMCFSSPNASKDDYKLWSLPIY